MVSTESGATCMHARALLLAGVLGSAAAACAPDFSRYPSLADQPPGAPLRADTVGWRLHVLEGIPVAIRLPPAFGDVHFIELNRPATPWQWGAGGVQANAYVGTSDSDSPPEVPLSSVRSIPYLASRRDVRHWNEQPVAPGAPPLEFLSYRYGEHFLASARWPTGQGEWAHFALWTKDSATAALFPTMARTIVVGPPALWASRACRTLRPACKLSVEDTVSR